MTLCCYKCGVPTRAVDNSLVYEPPFCLSCWKTRHRVLQHIDQGSCYNCGVRTSRLDLTQYGFPSLCERCENQREGILQPYLEEYEDERHAELSVALLDEDPSLFHPTIKACIGPNLISFATNGYTTHMESLFHGDVRAREVSISTVRSQGMYLFFHGQTCRMVYNAWDEFALGYTPLSGMHVIHCKPEGVRGARKVFFPRETNRVPSRVPCRVPCRIFVLDWAASSPQRPPGATPFDVIDVSHSSSMILERAQAIAAVQENEPPNHANGNV
jgi:hypothetical protein